MLLEVRKFVLRGMEKLAINFVDKYEDVVMLNIEIMAAPNRKYDDAAIESWLHALDQAMLSPESSQSLSSLGFLLPLNVLSSSPPLYHNVFMRFISFLA